MDQNIIAHDKQPKLSIIVPVYNVEEYLEECLNSLINQNVSYDLYEIICIDDGSPDNCGVILDEYKKKYPYITVIHQENAGQAMARNAGLAVASGEYIWFVDSDDFIPNYAVNRIISSIKNHNADIFWIGMYRFSGNSVKYDDTDIEKYNSNIKLRSCYSVKSIRKKTFLEDNKIIFDDKMTSYAEDFLIHFKVMKCNPVEFVITEKPLYFYRYVNSSSSNTLTYDSIIERVNAWLYVLEVQREYFEKDNIKDKNKTAIEMQGSIKGIFHWLSLIKNTHLDCFNETFSKKYLPYFVSINPLCLYISLRAFWFRRVVNSYNGKMFLFKKHISISEAKIIKNAKKRIRALLKK